MARFVNEVLFMSMVWIVMVHEAAFQSQTMQNNRASHPEMSLDTSGAAEHDLTNDVIEMGRTAAEDMGNLMASLPINILHSNQGPQHQPSNNRLLSEFQLPTTLNFRQPSYQFLRDGSDYEYCVPRSSFSTSAEWNGRSSSGRTNPMRLPLVPLPLSQPLFILDALLPRPTPLGRLLTPRRPRLPPQVPFVPKLSIPSPLIRHSPLPLIPPATVPLIPKLRSSFTPYSYYLQQKPLVLYAR